jgi:hypothetical protein
VAHTAFKGLDANEIGCVRTSIMAGSNSLRSKGRIQMRETSHLQIVTSSLQHTVGPYRCANSGLMQRSSVLGHQTSPAMASISRVCRHLDANSGTVITAYGIVGCVDIIDIPRTDELNLEDPSSSPSRRSAGGLVRRIQNGSGGLYPCSVLADAMRASLNDLAKVDHSGTRVYAVAGP